VEGKPKGLGRLLRRVIVFALADVHDQKHGCGRRDADLAEHKAG
jgi:hypothetical protein